MCCEQNDQEHTGGLAPLNRLQCNRQAASSSPVSKSLLLLVLRERAWAAPQSFLMIPGGIEHGRPVSSGVDVLPTLRVLFGHISACCGTMAVAMQYRKGLQRVSSPPTCPHRCPRHASQC